MDYKEEYQKALERAKQGLPIDEVFPELKEGEDEKIRKEIISCIKSHILPGGLLVRGGEFYREDAITYLEKQKEQKHAEWSEEDEERIKSIKATLKQFAYSNGMLDVNGDYCDASIIKNMNWLKDLHTKVHMQPKQEWSDKDKEMFDRCIANAKKHIPIPDKNGHLAKIEERVDEELVDWLKKRFFNVHWKPSEEQINYLAKAIQTLGEEGDCKTANILNELLNDLKHYNYEIQKQKS